MHDGLSASVRFVEVPGHVSPESGVAMAVRAARGIAVRAAHWVPPAARGTVLVCTGRSEFIEKYFDVVRDLLGRGFAVVAFDWRGQGLSTRALRNRRKGHVGDFSEYHADLQAVVEDSAIGLVSYTSVLAAAYLLLPAPYSRMIFARSRYLLRKRR